jgi:hypothetical protein
MEENRVAELLTLVLDQDVPICPALLNSASDFARNELGIELRPFQKDGIAYLISKETGKVLTMVRPPGDGKSLTYIVAGDFIPKLKDASLTKGVWAYANSTAVRKTIDTHNVEMLTMQLLAAKILLRKFVVSKNKEGESITTVHVRGALNSQEDGYLFSELEAYACIPKVRM